MTVNYDTVPEHTLVADTFLPEKRRPKKEHYLYNQYYKLTISWDNIYNWRMDADWFCV
jgi:hypothetical protein